MFIGWNTLLTALLFSFIFIRPHEISRAPAGQKSDMSAKSTILSSGLPFSTIRDSLISPGRKIRSKILNEKIYNLNIPLRKGWIINIWRNNWPVLAKAAPETKDYIFPINLAYDQNIVRLSIWDERQELVHQDNYQIIYRNPVVELLRRSIDRGNTENRQLALTFDGGSSAAGAKTILEALGENNVTTTMFISGQFIEKYPEIVMEMVAAGHELGNHTYNHPHLTSYETNGRQETLEGVDQDFMAMQLLGTDSLFYALTGRHLAPFWRAPYGEYNQQILDWAAELGYMHVRWTPGFDTFDWVDDVNSPIYKTASQVLEEIITRAEDGETLNGAIFLMHLGSHRTKDNIYEIVPGLIAELRSRGYTMVPVSNLLNP